MERGGRIRRRVVANVAGDTLKAEIRRVVHPSAIIISDEHTAHWGLGKEFEGGRDHVSHGRREYVRGDVNTNTVESSFALVKRGLIGVYHNVSREHLHRYIDQYDFLWNTRTMNDGERTALAIQSAEGKRLMYRQPAA